MKNYKKLLISLLSAAAVLVIIVAGAFIVLNSISKSGTIEEILQINFDDIAYIKEGNVAQQPDDYPVADFIKKYKSAVFEQFSGSIGGTAHRYYVAYDQDNQIVFTLVSIGNRELYFISKGSFDINESYSDKLYQLKQ